MTRLLAASRRRGARFARETEGGVTIEFVLWVPFFCAILVATVDVSLLFMTQSNYWSVSRDTARLVARHAMTEAAAESYAQTRATFAGNVPTTDVTINGATVTVTISNPASEIAPFNALGLSGDRVIDASVTQTLEPI
jgi:Flp pilus assembly protein TadG